jgi:hypothetical protein
MALKASCRSCEQHRAWPVGAVGLRRIKMLEAQEWCGTPRTAHAQRTPNADDFPWAPPVPATAMPSPRARS